MAEASIPAGGDANNQQPGQVIKPGQSESSIDAAPTSPPVVAAPPQSVQSPAAPQQATESSFKFSPNENQATTQPEPNRTQAHSSDEGVTWTASEFVAHEKSTGWYATLLLATIIIIVIVYLLTRDKVSAGVVLICAAFLAILAGRKPRQLQYRVDGSGVTVGQKHFEYGLFKSFAVVPEGTFSSIVFMPLKRFAPLTTIYYAPEDEEKIVNLLSDQLPFERHKLDAVDSLMRRIRF